MLLAISAFSQTQKSKSDSLAKPTFIITPRINSAGHFPFSGAYLNKNTNVDLNIFYQQRNGFGFFIFQSFDVEDRHSIVNYLQPGVFKKIKLNPKLQLGLFAGYVFSQTEGFRDKDSDYFTAAVFYLTINPQLKLESTSLFFDWSQSTKLANRLLASYALKDFKFDFYLWHRVVFETGLNAVSASIAINPPKVEITRTLSLQTTFSYLGYLTQAKPDFAIRDGFLFSVAFPLGF